MKHSTGKTGTMSDHLKQLVLIEFLTSTVLVVKSCTQNAVLKSYTTITATYCMQMQNKLRKFKY